MDPRLAPLRAHESPLKRHLGFVAILGEEMRRLGAELPIVVGDHALEIYTGGHYATADIDLVVADGTALARALEGLGLERRADERRAT